MGYQAYIKDLSPIAYYTFDKSTTFIDTDIGEGIYLNSVETDVEALNLNFSSAMGKLERVEPRRPSIANAEMGSYYQSFCTTEPLLSYFYVKNVIGGGYSQKYYPISSAYVDLIESKELENLTLEQDISCSFQIKFNNFTKPLYFSEYTQVPLLNLGDTFKQVNSQFGMYARFALQQYDKTNTMIFRESNEEEDKQFSEFYAFSDVKELFAPPRLLRESKLSMPHKTVVDFCGIKLTTTFGNTLCYNGTDNIITTLYEDTTYSIVINYKRDIHSLFFYINGEYKTKIKLTEKEKITNNLQYGIKCESVFQGIVDNDELYILKTSPVIYTFDNISIYDYNLSDIQIRKIYLYSLLIKERYLECGFTNLFDEEERLLKTKYKYMDETKHIIPRNLMNQYNSEDYPRVYNLIGSDYLYVTSNPNGKKIEEKYATCHLIENETSLLRSYIRLIPYTNLFNRRFLHHTSIYSYYYDRSFQLFDMSNGAFSFNFRTESLNGNIFSNTVLDTNNSNLSLKMINGDLVIYYGMLKRNTIPNMNNNQWHSVFLYSDGERIKIYINDMLYLDEDCHGMTQEDRQIFGSMVGECTDMILDVAMIATAKKDVTYERFKIYTDTYVPYTMEGKVTVNNIGVYSKIFIYNNETGELIKKITSDEYSNGTFTYTNTYPYTVSVIVTSTYNHSKTYIISPINII